MSNKKTTKPTPYALASALGIGMALSALAYSPVTLAQQAYSTQPVLETTPGMAPVSATAPTAPMTEEQKIRQARALEEVARADALNAQAQQIAAQRKANANASAAGTTGIPSAVGANGSGVAGTIAATPPRIPKIGEGVDPAVLAAVYNGVKPLSPSQIRDVNRRLDGVIAAENYHNLPPAKPVTSVTKVSLAPGASIPVLRVAPGKNSTLVITDSTGAPWPVLEVMCGAETFSCVEPVAGTRTNMVVVNSNSIGGETNISIFLAGANAPLILTMVSDQAVSDYRMDLVIQAAGPNATRAEVRSNVASINTNTQLQELLQGITPSGLSALSVRGSLSDSVQAWSDASGSRTYLRTTMQLVSPGALQVGRLVDGAYGYIIPRSEVVTFASHGKLYDVMLGGFPSAGTSFLVK